MPARRPRFLIRCLPLAALALGVSCTAPAVEPDFGSSRTAARVPAIVEAASPSGRGDELSAVQLVRQLDDPDAAVRLFAIGTLQRRTDRRFGYRWYQDAAARRPAVASWRAWADAQPG